MGFGIVLKKVGIIPIVRYTILMVGREKRNYEFFFLHPYYNSGSKGKWLKSIKQHPCFLSTYVHMADGILFW